MKKLKLILGLSTVGAVVSPMVVGATTDLLPLPGNWLDMIATSSVPLFTSLSPFMGWIIGIGVVALAFGLVFALLFR